MYEKTNRLTEKISKIMLFAIVYVSVPGFVLPTGIYCFFKYFTTDLGPDAFELPIPVWYVAILSILYYFSEMEKV